MRRLDNPMNDMRGIITYELDDGRRIDLDAKAVLMYGAATLIRGACGRDAISTKRLPVRQCGEIVGTTTPDFDPMMTRSTSPFYDVRPGDFKRDGDGWIADKSLGPGDFDSVPGFRALEPRKSDPSLAALSTIFATLRR